VQQPEFKTCMARDFAEYAFGNNVSPARVTALENMVRPGSTPVRELMRATLSELARSWSEVAPRSVPAATNRSEKTDTIALTPELRGRLNGLCMDCHDKEPDRPDFSPDHLRRGDVVDVLESVAYGKMPKDDPLADAARNEFLEAFIAAIWSGADADAARTYYIGRNTTIPAYRPEVAFAMIHRTTGATTKPPWRMLENAVRPRLLQLAPGLLTVEGLAAIEACRERNTARADIDRCIASAMKLENLTSRPH
jgi:hypothetical protein